MSTSGRVGASTSIARRKLIPAALPPRKDLMATCAATITRSLPPTAPRLLFRIPVDNLNKVASGGLLMRQGGGPDNSLGLIKFIFPNDSAVFSQHRSSRTFRTGRIGTTGSGYCAGRASRRSRHVGLHHNPGWNPQSIRATMDDPRVNDRRETLKKTTSVYLNYWTRSWVTVACDSTAIFTGMTIRCFKSLDFRARPCRQQRRRQLGQEAPRWRFFLDPL